MTTALAPERNEQRVILHGITWPTYARLCADRKDSHAAHFAYDQGTLEIMVLSFEHEAWNRLLALFFEAVAEERNIDFENAGSTTFQREDLGRGFEADTAFYVHHLDQIRGKKDLDLAVDPPPDLIIEVDLSSSSLDKLPIFASVGVPEVWHLENQVLTVLVLGKDGYRESPDSLALAGITRQDIQDWLQRGRAMKRNEWLKKLRSWVRETGQ